MASTSSTYLLPGPSSTIIGSKSILIRQSPPTMFHQFQHPHAHIVKSIPTNETFHSFPVPNTNNGSSFLPTNHHDDSGGSSSNGHSLSQSMESINNVGLTDDEVR
jgi:hypothetical protein